IVVAKIEKLSRDVLPDDTRLYLFATAACLNEAEVVELPMSHPLYVALRHSHRDALRDYLLNTSELDLHQINCLQEMGVERIDDLGTLSEGDLRQAGVHRVMSRKLLPFLVSLGNEASNHINSQSE